MHQLKISTTKDTFIKDYLTLINCFYDMTAMEMLVLREFISVYLSNLDSGSTPETAWEVTFSLRSKRKIADLLHYERMNILDQHLLSLKKKGVIRKEDDLIKINPLAIPSDNSIAVLFSSTNGYPIKLKQE